MAVISERSNEESPRLESFIKSEEAFENLEKLIERRPFLLSNVILRHNPSDVYEWLNRVKLCEDDVEATISTFTEAI